MARVFFSTVVAFLFLASGIAQAAATPPSVIDEAAAQISGTDATLEATLDAGSAAAGAYYQFQLAELPAEFPDELNCPPPPSSGPFLPCEGPEAAGALPIGKIAHSDNPAAVSLDLADAGVTLEPGQAYYFRVLVASAEGSEDTIAWEDPVVAGEGRTFTTSSSSPLVTGESVSAITSTDATLEASFDSGGAAYYQFQLAEFPAEFPDELSCPPPPVLGLPACVGPQSASALPIGYSGGGGQVALQLATAGVILNPGTTYYFRVLVAAAKPSEDSVEWEKPVAVGGVETFATSASPVGEPGPPAAGAAGVQAAAPMPVFQRRRHRHRRHHRSGHRHYRAAAIALGSVAR